MLYKGMAWAYEIIAPHVLDFFQPVIQPNKGGFLREGKDKQGTLGRGRVKGGEEGGWRREKGGGRMEGRREG